MGKRKDQKIGDQPQPQQQHHKRQRTKKQQKQEEEMINLDPPSHCPLCGNSSSNSGAVGGNDNQTTTVTETSIKLFSSILSKKYYKCGVCSLVFMHNHFFIQCDTEKSRYSNHKNSPQDLKYRKFLQPTIDKLIIQLDNQSSKDNKDIVSSNNNNNSSDNNNSEKNNEEQENDKQKDLQPLVKQEYRQLKGLDYGCGPGPTLCVMLSDIGITDIDNYDPYFKENDNVQRVIDSLKKNSSNNNNRQNTQDGLNNNDQQTTTTSTSSSIDHNSQIQPKESIIEPTQQQDKVETNTKVYDFITCTEALEHFRQPIDDLKILFSDGLLKRDGGILVIMTQFLKNDEMFEKWHYPRDPTHVCFYREETFKWIANHFNLQLNCYNDANVAVFTK